MEAIEKKVKSMLNAAIGATTGLVVLGIIFLIFPGFVISVFRITLAVILFAIGIGLIIHDVRRNTAFSAFGGSVIGVISMVLGILVVSNPGILNFIPVIIGLVMLLSSLFKFRLSLGLTHAPTNLLLISIITNVVTFICGLVLVFAPQGATEAAIRVLGIIFIVDGISTTVDVLMLKQNVADFKRAFSKMGRTASKTMNAVEAEVVSEKPKKGTKKTARKAAEVPKKSDDTPKKADK